MTLDNLVSIGISRDPGVDYDTNNFEILCEQIHAQVKKFHNQNKIFKVKKMEITRSPIEAQKGQIFEWNNFLAILERIIESDNLKFFHANNTAAIANLLGGLKNGNIDDGTFSLQISQLFSFWLMTRQSQKQ